MDSQQKRILLLGNYYHILRTWNLIDHLKSLTNTNSLTILDEEYPWVYFEYISETPFRQSELEEKPPYFYKVFYRQSEERAIILSDALGVVSYISTYMANALNMLGFDNVRVKINSLVNEIIDDSNYTITFIHAKTPGFGSALKSISLYGDDITKISMFHENRFNIQCHMCGMRKISK